MIFTAIDNNHSKRTKQANSTSNPPDYQKLLDTLLTTHYLRRPIVQRGPWPAHIRPPPFTRRPLSPFLGRTQRNREDNSRFLVENWRKSIVGLVRMAQRNVASAEKVHFEIRRDYRTAVEVAFTGVENISRALIHCYGGKPNPGPGQEEALRLVSQRLHGDEKTAFDKAIDKVANITQRKMAFPYQVQYVSTNNVQIRPLGKEETRDILKSVSNIVSLFKRIIINNFSTEIPELQNIAHPRHSSSTDT